MKKTKKKLTPQTKKLIKFMVERYLEVTTEDVLQLMRSKKAVDEYWKNLSKTLFDNGFWMDEPDSEDMKHINKKALVIEYHRLLKPLWDQFKAGLFDYQNSVLPDKKRSKALLQDTEGLKSAGLYEYKDLMVQSDRSLEEKFYDVLIQLKISFDSGSISFFKRQLSVIENFLDLVNALPVSLFVQCQHCNKCIVKSRSDKQFCPGCAAKKYQIDKWKNDPEAMRSKERERYHKRSKRQV